MLFKLILHENEKIDKALKRFLLLGAFIGMLTSAWKWAIPAVDHLWTTEPELVLAVDTKMSKHEQEIAQVPYAMKADVVQLGNHLENVGLEEQICDAEALIASYEDAEAAGTATAVDVLDKKRQEKFAKNKRENLKEDGHNHSECD